jgi:hypothetical protein
LLSANYEFVERHPESNSVFMRQPENQFTSARQNPAFLDSPKRRNMSDCRLKYKRVNTGNLQRKLELTLIELVQ